MNLADCYRVLGLRSGASYHQVKAAYRRLARQCHPDANPGDPLAEAKFIHLTQAYKKLLEVLPPEPVSQPGPSPSESAASASDPNVTFRVKITRKPPPADPAPSPESPVPGSHSPQSPEATPTPAAAQSPASQSPASQSTASESSASQTPGQSGVSPTPVEFGPELSEIDRKLKQQSYEQLQQFLKTQRFPRAIALVEGLAQRLPQDAEVRQWQAITYQRWARRLIQQREFDKARVYLKKALKTDPHNKTLWAEVEKEFQHLERLY